MIQMIEFQPKTERGIQENLHEIAAKHAARNDLLHLLPLDPDAYPGQSLTEHTIRSKIALGPEETEKIALKIEPRYKSLQVAYKEYCDPSAPTHERMKNVLAAMLAGTHIINGSDHAELFDIIFNHLHFSNLARTSMRQKEEALGLKHRGIRSGVIVSKMIDFLGIEYKDEIVPVRDLMGLGFDITYLTIPNNATTGSKFEPGARKRYNSAVRSEIESDLRPRPISNQRPLILGVALPGTINKLAQNDTSTWVVGQANPAITSFTKDALTVVSAVRMSKDRSQVFIDSELLNIYNADQLHYAMGRLVAGIELLDKQKYLYDINGNTVVID